MLGGSAQLPIYYLLNPSQRYVGQSLWTKFRTSPAGTTACTLFLTETSKKFKGAGLTKLVKRWKSMRNMTTVLCINFRAAHVLCSEKIKVPRNRTEGPGRGRGIVLHFLDFGTRVVGGQRHVPAALPSGKSRYPLYRRLGAPQGRSGHVRRILPPLEFDHRTVQPVASRYTD
jgi:hypothetical protein